MRHKLKALVKEENLDVTPSANFEQCEHQTRNIKLRCRLRASGEGGGGILLGIRGGVCRPNLQILTLFHTQKMLFSSPVSDQTFKIHERVILAKEISKSVKCFQISY